MQFSKVSNKFKLSWKKWSQIIIQEFNYQAAEGGKCKGLIKMQFEKSHGVKAVMNLSHSQLSFYQT